MDYTSSFFLYDILFNDTSQQLAFPIYAAQIKEAVLSGISLKDEKRDQFNKIEQVSSNLLCFQLRYILCGTSHVNYLFGTSRKVSLYKGSVFRLQLKFHPVGI